MPMRCCGCIFADADMHRAAVAISVWPVHDYPFEPPQAFSAFGRATALYAVYNGDETYTADAVKMLDYMIINGSTPDDPTWAWPAVPYASSDGGALRFRGAHDIDRYCHGAPAQRAARCYGHGDGYGVLETDKVALAGNVYMLYWKRLALSRFLTAAVKCAEALTANVIPGDAVHSPWPFRVFAESNIVREQYGPHVVEALQLYDALLDLQHDARAIAVAEFSVTNFTAHAAARDLALKWLLAYPMRNRAWCNYCEDVGVQTDLTVDTAAAGDCNWNSITPTYTADYLLANPEKDPQWEEHVASMIAFVEEKLGYGINSTGAPALAWGALTISEQRLDTDKMGVHTARYAVTLATLADKLRNAGKHATADVALEKARRSWNWASYTLSGNGSVGGPIRITAYSQGESDVWFCGQSHVPWHTLRLLGWDPVRAPSDATHIVRSTSVVVKAQYTSRGVYYSTFDKNATEVLRLASSLVAKATSIVVTANGTVLPRKYTDAGLVDDWWRLDTTTGVVTVVHSAGNHISVEGS